MTSNEVREQIMAEVDKFHDRMMINIILAFTSGFVLGLMITWVAAW